MPVYAPRSFFPALCLDGHLSVQPTRNSNDASSVSSLLGLAPGGGCLAARIAANAGGLLHRLFTMTQGGCLFLWPCPASYLAPGFPRCRALWSADFPRPCAEAQNRDRPADLRLFYHTCSWNLRQPPGTVFLKSRRRNSWTRISRNGRITFRTHGKIRGVRVVRVQNWFLICTLRTPLPPAADNWV